MEMQKYENFASEIQNALTSEPINTSYLINIIKQTNNFERQLIRENYFKLTNIELIEDLKSQRQIEGKSFECLFIGLFRTPTEYDVYEIFEAVDGIGTIEDILSEILGTRDSHRIQEIKKFYSILFSRDLEEVLNEEGLPKDYLNFLQKILMKNEKNENSTKSNSDKILSDFDLKNLNSQNLKKEKKMEIFSKILYIENSDNKKNCEILRKFIEKEFQNEKKNPLRNLLIYTLNAQSDFIRFYAERLFNALKAEKKDNKIIMRTMLSIYPRHLTEFQTLLKREFKINLKDLISQNATGLFKDLLLQVADSDNYA